MKISLKYFLLAVFLLFSFENYGGFHVHPDSPLKFETSAGINAKNLILRNADTRNLCHGLKVETTVIPGPTSNDPGIRNLKCISFLIYIYNKKKKSLISFTSLLSSDTIRRSTLSVTLRI